MLRESMLGRHDDTIVILENNNNGKLIEVK